MLAGLLLICPHGTVSSNVTTKGQQSEGVSMKARLNKISLKSSDQINVSENLTVLVGPNNVGKSVLLSSLWNKMQYIVGHPPVETPVVESFEASLPPEQELRERLEALAVRMPHGQHPHGNYSEAHYFFNDTRQVVLDSQIANLYTNNSSVTTFSTLAQHMAVLLQPETRLGQLAPTNTPNLLSEGAQNPQQIIYSDRSIEEKLSNYAKRAFQIDLTMNRHAGSQISLHVGSPTASEPSIGDLTPYQSQLASLPLANNQGHGVQAFLGMLSVLVAKTYDIVMIDEPEAFLHPPQARLLGEILVELSKQNTQVIISTHSNDILQGILTASAETGEVTIARLTRPEETLNRVAQVNPASVKTLFEDPLLRYSNVLNGIFYKGVVLCESESDSKYYSAVLDEMYSNVDPGDSRPDLFFTQCGGKDRLAKAYTALKSTAVPTAIITDIDILNDKEKFKVIFEAVGGNFNDIQGKYNTIVDAVRNKGSSPNRRLAKDQINNLLDSSDSEKLTKDENGALREIIKVSTGWDDLKRAGSASLPGGAPTQSFNSILEVCASKGLYILKIGELERFHPEVVTNKQRWLRQVFEDQLFKNSPYANELLGSIVSYIAKSQ